MVSCMENPIIHSVNLVPTRGSVHFQCSNSGKQQTSAMVSEDTNQISSVWNKNVNKTTHLVPFQPHNSKNTCHHLSGWQSPS